MWEVASDEGFTAVVRSGVAVADARPRPRGARRRRRARTGHRLPLPLHRRRAHQPRRRGPGRCPTARPTRFGLARRQLPVVRDRRPTPPTGTCSTRTSTSSCTSATTSTSYAGISEGERTTLPSPRAGDAHRLPAAVRVVQARRGPPQRAPPLPVRADVGRPRGGQQLQRRHPRPEPDSPEAARARKAAAYQAWWEHLPVRVGPPDGRRARRPPAHRRRRPGPHLPARPAAVQRRPALPRRRPERRRLRRLRRAARRPVAPGRRPGGVVRRGERRQHGHLEPDRQPGGARRHRRWQRRRRAPPTTSTPGTGTRPPATASSSSSPPSTTRSCSPATTTPGCSSTCTSSPSSRTARWWRPSSCRRPISSPLFPADVTERSPQVRRQINGHGYLAVEVTPERVRASFQVLDDVTDPASAISTQLACTIEAGSPEATIDQG